MNRKPLRLTLSRSEVVTVIYALEDAIEDCKYHGGLELAENEVALLEKVEKRLRDHDFGRRPATTTTATQSSPASEVSS